MRQEVPQFIDVEDKIFGPFTFKQFIYLAGGAALSYLSFRIIPMPFAILGIGFFGGLALALAFYRPNNRPFIEIMQSWISYQTKAKLYLWKKPDQTKTSQQPQLPEIKAPEAVVAPKAERNISDLARNLDILDQSK